MTSPRQPLAVVPIYLEEGSKKVFACAYPYPGWARWGKDDQQAMERLLAYAPRYRVVTEEAGVAFPTQDQLLLEVLARVEGNATTDFGAPGAVAPGDDLELTAAEAEQLAALMEAAWTVFTRVAAAAPAELRKGPRGGGRDRDAVVAHVVEAERAHARSLGLKIAPLDPADRAAVAGMRTALSSAVRAAPTQPPPGRWPSRYAVRRVVWHVLDHAWEIEDRIP
jgi:hypothetical protein